MLLFLFIVALIKSLLIVMFMKNAYKLINKAALFFQSPLAFWLTLPAKLSAAIAIFKIHSFLHYKYLRDHPFIFFTRNPPLSYLNAQQDRKKKHLLNISSHFESFIDRLNSINQ